MLQLKRAYDRADPEDGVRLLVDRLWPRGVPKERLRVDLWAKELAPSPELRVWFAHRPERFPEFRRRYRSELASHTEQLRSIAEKARRGTVTLVFAAREPARSNAAVLREVLEAALSGRPTHRRRPRLPGG